MEDFSYLIGKNVTEARKLVHEPTWLCTVKKDGKDCCITCDLIVNRLQIEVENSIIKKIINLG